MRGYRKYRRYMRREKRSHRQERSFHRWLAVFMAAVLLMSESNLTVLAEEGTPYAEAQEGEVSDEVSSEETEEGDELPCEEGDDAIDDAGDAEEDNAGGAGDDEDGAGDVDDGDGLLGEDNVDKKSCSCKSRCSEDMVNEDCPVCVVSYEDCSVLESDNPEVLENDAVIAEAEVSEDERIETYAVGDTFQDAQGIMYRIIKDDEDDRQVEIYYGDQVDEVRISETVYNNGSPYSVTSIGVSAFRNCSSLTSIEIPNSVTSIGFGAFGNCSNLTSIKIPYDITSIEGDTFRGCSSLPSIEIPNSVTSIGIYAFAGCSSLTSIKIPDGVTCIDLGTFWNCSNLECIEIPDSVTSIGDTAFDGCSSLTSIGIPDSVTSIGLDAFGDCSSLTSIEIPDGVTSISNMTFIGCSSLTSIKIPDGVTSIGNGAFSGCSSLTGIDIPKGVTSIDSSAFSGCSSLTSIEIPDGVTEIGHSMFERCSSLTSIEIPDSVTSIGPNAFWECKNLTGIKIPDGVTSIGGAAFVSCYGLTSIKIPDSVTSIDRGAFWDCENLSTLEIVIPSDGTGIIVPEVGIRVFSFTPDDRYIIFVTEDGSPLTGSAFETARAAYKADDRDGNADDDLWWGWKFKEPDISSSITISVRKDKADWSDHNKSFGLKPTGNPDAVLITDFTSVADGEYKIYDITDAADGASGIDTGESITVSNGGGEVTVDYYTVTFYDGSTAYEADTPQAMQTVLSGKKAMEPDEAPSKEGYKFNQWVTKNNGSETFDFDVPIKDKSSVYASWISDTAKEYCIAALSDEGGSISPGGNVWVQEGGTQIFEIVPNRGYRIKAVTVDGMDRTDELTDSASAKAIRAQAETSKYYTFVDVRESHTIRATFETESSSGDNGDTGTGDNTGDSGNTGTGEDNGDSGDTGTEDNGGDSGDDGTYSDGSGDNNNADAEENVFISVSTTVNADNSTPVDNSSTTNNNTSNPSKDAEPKTGDASHVEIYATVAMIAGLTYLLLYFADKEKGMTEEKKQELVSSMIGWAKRGRRIRKYVVLVPIFILLCYYHSIGKRIEVEWEEEPVWAEL